MCVKKINLMLDSAKGVTSHFVEFVIQQFSAGVWQSEVGHSVGKRDQYFRSAFPQKRSGSWRRQRGKIGASYLVKWRGASISHSVGMGPAGQTTSQIWRRLLRDWRNRSNERRGDSGTVID